MAASVSPATAAEWPAAGRVLFAASDDPGRATAKFLALIASRDIDPAGVFVARNRAGVCGAMLAQPFAGGQAAVWPPAVPDRPEQDRIEDELTAAALGWLRAGGAKVAQAVLHPGEPGVPALLRAGFERVTELAFLARDLGGGDTGDRPLSLRCGVRGDVVADAYPPHPDPLPPQSRGEREHGSPLSITPYSPANAAAFADVLLASYDGTRDCPELNGTRTADEIIAGYRDAMPGGSREWFLASAGGSPVAVLLLAGPTAGAWTLTYLGVVPTARGKGIGRTLTRFAVGRAAAASAPGMTLSVDVRNEPALRLYAGEGFAEYDRREVYLAVW